MSEKVHFNHQAYDLCKTIYEVDERGIVEVNQYFDSYCPSLTVCQSKVVITKDAFIKAHDMFINGKKKNNICTYKKIGEIYNGNLKEMYEHYRKRTEELEKRCDTLKCIIAGIIMFIIVIAPFIINASMYSVK